LDQDDHLTAKPSLDEDSSDEDPYDPITNPFNFKALRNDYKGAYSALKDLFKDGVISQGIFESEIFRLKRYPDKMLDGWLPLTQDLIHRAGGA